MGSWHVNPHAPAVQRLIRLIEEAFLAGSGDFNAGRTLPSILRRFGIEPDIDAHVVALPPGHPYLRLPIQFATSLRPRLEALAGKAELDDLMSQAELESVGQAPQAYHLHTDPGLWQGDGMTLEMAGFIRCTGPRGPQVYITTRFKPR